MNTVVDWYPWSEEAYTNAKFWLSQRSEKGTSVYVSPQKLGNDYQLWQRKVMRKDKSLYALVNKATGTCIARKDNSEGSKLYLAKISEADLNDRMVWLDDTVPGTYNAIRSLVDFEQKINIPGNGPYTDGLELITWGWCGEQINELWTFVEDEKTINIKKIDFQLDLAKPESNQPVVAASQIITNSTDTDQSQTVTLSFSKGHTYSFTREKGIKISESIEFKGGLPLVEESKVTIAVEGTRTYSETETQEDTEQVTLEIPVALPAGKKVQVSAILLQGKIEVPYTATFEIEYPGETVVVTNSGKYTGVNTYTVTTKFEYLT
jgi:hypothetical protein